MTGVNDQYAFDPYQSEEDALKELEKRALAQSLRKWGKRQGQAVGGLLIGGPSAGDSFGRMVEGAEADRILNQELPARRKALQQKAQDDLEQSLTGAGIDEETKALFRSPMTRAQGAAVLKTTLDRKQANKDYEDFLRMRGGISPIGPQRVNSGEQPTQIPGQPQSGGPPPLQLLQDMAISHPNPTMKAWAKQQIEMFYPNTKDPEKLGIRPDGTYGMDPAAVPAILARRGAEERSRADYDLVDYPIGGGRTIKIPRSQAVELSRGGQVQSPQSAGPGPVGVGVAPPSGGGFSPGSGMPGAPVQGGAAGGAAPSSAHLAEAWKILNDPNVDPQVKASVAQGLSSSGYEFDTNSGIAPRLKQQNAAGPRSQMGVSDPEASKMRQLGMESGRKILDKERELLGKDTAALKTMQRMSELNQQGQIMTGPFAGPMFTARRAAHLMGVRDDPQVAATEEYEKLKLTQLRDSLKAYGSGTGISNLDLITAQKTLPGIENTPEGRQRIIDYMQGQILTNIKNFQDAEKYFMANRTLDGFEPQNYDKDGRLVTQQEMQQRLIQAKKEAQFEQRRQDELGKLKANEPVLKNALKDIGHHSYELATGDPEHLEKFGKGAVAGAALVPAGRAASAALPYALRAGAAAGRGLSAAGGAVGRALTSPMAGNSILALALYHALKKEAQQ